MKLFIALLACAVTANVSGALLGAKKCTWGPSYWCSALTAAAKCKATQHCIDKVWKTDRVKRAVDVILTTDTDDACTFCENIVSDVKNFIESNQTEYAMTSYMRKGCAFFPDTFSQNECFNVADHYMVEFLQLVDSDIDAKKVCSLAKLCVNPKTQDLTSSKQITLNRASLHSVAVSAPQDDMCDMCKETMSKVKKEIDDPANQAKLLSDLQAACQKLGGLAAECSDLVKQYLPQLEKFADDNIGQVCAAVGLCNSTMEIDFKALALQAMNEAGIVSDIKSLSSRVRGVDGQYCDMCEEVFGYISIFMNNNSTMLQVEQLIENDVCTQLGSFSDMCKTVVAQYMPELWSKVMEELAPATVCTDLGLCNATAVVEVEPKTTPVVKERAKASIQCVLCEFLISKLEGMVTTNSTVQEIEKAVEEVCSLLPSTVKTDCDNLVEQYGPAIIKLLINSAQPSTICGFLGLCATGDSMYKTPIVAGGECAPCEMSMTFLKSILGQNSTDQQVIEAVEKVCNYMSGTAAQECNTLVEKYAPQMIQMLVNDIDPKQVCTKLGLCTSWRRVDGLVYLHN